MVHLALDGICVALTNAFEAYGNHLQLLKRRVASAKNKRQLTRILCVRSLDGEEAKREGKRENNKLFLLFLSPFFASSLSLSLPGRSSSNSIDTIASHSHLHGTRLQMRWITRLRVTTTTTTAQIACYLLFLKFNLMK